MLLTSARVEWLFSIGLQPLHGPFETGNLEGARRFMWVSAPRFGGQSRLRSAGRTSLFHSWTHARGRPRSVSPIWSAPHGPTHYSLDTLLSLLLRLSRLYKTDMAVKRTFVLTDEEKAELQNLLNTHDALSKRVESLDQSLSMQNEDDYENEDDPEMREAIAAVLKARLAINKWTDKHLDPSRDIYSRQLDMFPAAPLLRLSDDAEANLELPSYDAEFGEGYELETEPNLGDILDPPGELDRLRYIAKHGHPRFEAPQRKAMKKLIEQCLSLVEQLKEITK